MYGIVFCQTVESEEGFCGSESNRGTSLQRDVANKQQQDVHLPMYSGQT